MDDCRVLAVLAEADASASLPRLGGMARPDGVAIVSERFWAFSRAGETAISVCAMPRPRATLARVPLLRGLLRLGSAVVPLLGRNSSASRKERLLLLVALAAPLALLAVPPDYRTPLLAALSVALVCWMFRGRTLRLHGAEHRAIAAAEGRMLVKTWYGSSRPSRFSPRCGTNFAALLVGVSLLLDHISIFSGGAVMSVVVVVLALMITMEIWLVAQRSGRWLGRVLLAPGLVLQRLTTREPTVDETRVALRAVAAVVAADR